MNKGVSPDNEGKNEPTKVRKTKKSDALKTIGNPRNKPTVESRKIAILCADGVTEQSVMTIKSALLKEGAKGLIVAPYLGFVKTDMDGELAIDFSFTTSHSVLFDAVYIPGGAGQNVMCTDSDVLQFINDTYRHCKIIGVDGEGIDVLAASGFAGKLKDNTDEGILMTKEPANELFAHKFIEAVSKHRIWEREAMA
jgi:catalase